MNETRVASLAPAPGRWSAASAAAARPAAGHAGWNECRRPVAIGSAAAGRSSSKEEAGEEESGDEEEEEEKKDEL